MGSEAYPLRRIGIYYNLPDFDPSIKDLTAIITGANGISGFSTLRALLDSPKRWTKVFALSRKPPPEPMMALLSPEQRARVQHVACDFLEDPRKIASSLEACKVSADYVFFYSYLQPKVPHDARIWSNADELVKVNTALLSNFLSALPLAGIKPQRFMLQTGAKNYGPHLGRVRTPMTESDPQPSHLAPNFYYSQEAALFDYCQTHNVGWNIVMPQWIIGATSNAAMNAFHPYAVYAAVQARKGAPLSFPGDWVTWQHCSTHSTARLTGYLTEWVVLEDKCKNQRFNSNDTSPLTFDRFYEELSQWYAVEKGVIPPPENDDEYVVAYGNGGKDAPLGIGPPMVSRHKFSLLEWAKDTENKKTWESLMVESGGHLTHNPFDDPQDHFSCGDIAYVPTEMSMNKARKLGWAGFVDTVESVFEMYHEMGKLGMLPPVKIDAAKVLAS